MGNLASPEAAASSSRPRLLDVFTFLPPRHPLPITYLGSGYSSGEVNDESQSVLQCRGFPFGLGVFLSLLR